MDRKQTIGYVLIFIIIAVTFYLNQQNASEIEKFNKTEDSLKLVAKKDSINQAPNQTPNQTPDQAAVQTLSADSLKEVEVDLPEKIYSIEKQQT